MTASRICRRAPALLRPPRGRAGRYPRPGVVRDPSPMIAAGCRWWCPTGMGCGFRLSWTWCRRWAGRCGTGTASIRKRTSPRRPPPWGSPMSRPIPLVSRPNRIQRMDLPAPGQGRAGLSSGAFDYQDDHLALVDAVAEHVRLTDVVGPGCQGTCRSADRAHPRGRRGGRSYDLIGVGTSTKTFSPSTVTG